MKCVFFGFAFALFVFVGFCDGEKVLKRQTRGAYGTKQPADQEREKIVLNDFAIIRESTRPNSDHNHPYHNHGPYHSYHGFSEPPDGFHYHHHDDEFVSLPTDYGDNSSGIPLDFAKSISEYSVSDLLLNVIEDAPQEKPSLASRFGEDAADQTERNAAQIARPAKCIPELTTVKIAESNDANIFYVPECTRVERCGGCCSHVLLACQPVETETVTFTVIKTEYTDKKKLKYVGKEPVLVEKHTKCKCGCKVKQEDCNSYQEYKEAECRCVCKNLDEEKKCYKNGSKKLWNPDVCDCQCREVLPCSTGFQFDYNECRCVQSQLKRRYILTESRKEAMEAPPPQGTD